MSKILSAEMFKVMKGKALMINSLIVVGFVIFFSLLAIFSLNTFTDEELINLGLYGAFPEEGLRALVYSLPFFREVIIICAAVLSGIWICDEFDSGTIRNILSTGASRTKFYFSKLIFIFLTSVVFILISALIYFLITTVAFSLGDSSSIDVANSLFFLIGMLLSYLTYVSIFVMMGFLFRNIGATLGVGIGFAALAETLLIWGLGFVGPLRFLLNIFPLHNVGRFNDVFNAGINNQILITDGVVYSELLGTYIPVITETKSAANEYIIAVVLCVAMIIIATLIGVLTFKKRDVK